MATEMAMRKRREHDLVMALRGYAPISASCKRIRGVSGEWQSLEDYVKTHSDVQVDDTICQHCVEQWGKDQEAA